MRQKTSIYAKWFLPLLFVTYYGIVILFSHAHIENGTTIIHSHFFEKNEDGTYHHHKSSSEIQLFHLLSTITAGNNAVNQLTVNFYTTPLVDISESPIYPDHLVCIPGKLSLRAPPVA